MKTHADGTPFTTEERLAELEADAAVLAPFINSFRIAQKSGAWIKEQLKFLTPIAALGLAVMTYLNNTKK